MTEANLAQLLFGQGEYDQGLSFAWDAYTLLQESGYLHDAQSMQSILVSMKGTHLAQFTRSWEHQIKEEQPDWLRNLQEDEAISETIEIPKDVVQIVRDFLTTKSWEETHQVLVQQQVRLFQPEVEELLKYQIALVEKSGEQQTAEMLLLHLDLLRDAKTEGIECAFENLAQKITPPFDMELITHSHAALHQGPTEKMAHMQYLTTLASQTTNEGTKKLIEAIQFALLGGDLSQLGQDLDGVYRQAWEAIVRDVDEDEET